MKVPNKTPNAPSSMVSLSRLQNEGSQPCLDGKGAADKSIKATE